MIRYHAGTRCSSKLTARRRGIALVWVVLIIVVLVSIVGLGIDTLHVGLAAQQLQAGADAAALAAARQVSGNPLDARSAAIQIALKNQATKQPIKLASNSSNADDGDIVLGRYDRAARIFTATEVSANAVKVVARRTGGSISGPLPLLFGPAFGVNEIDVSRTAIAMVQQTTGAAVIVLGQDQPCTLSLSAGATMTVPNGAVHVNSTNPQAICLSGSAMIDASQVNVGGGVRNSGSSGFSGAVNEGAASQPDPYSSLRAPSFEPADDLGSIDVSGINTLEVITPGYYSGGINVSGQGSLTLAPGIYVLGDRGLTVSGAANLVADGVMLYISGPNARVVVSGRGEVRIEPPDRSRHSFVGADRYHGVSIFQARGNTNTATISGGGELNLEGTLYFSENHVVASGDGSSIGDQLIAESVRVSGSGEVRINSDRPQQTLSSGNVFLVK